MPQQVMADNVASTLCYLAGLITGIIFLLIAPYNQNKNVRFHAFQSIFLNVAWIVVWVALRIILGIITGILGLYSLLFFMPLIGLAFFILWVYMMVATYQGKTIVLPIIGSIAQQQA